MTSPQGRAGITPGPLQDAVSIDGSNLAGRITGLPNLDQATAEQLLKTLYIQGNPKLNDPLGDIFAGLRPGIPWSLSMIEKLVQSIIGAPGQLFLNIAQASSVLALFMGGMTNSVTEHTEAIANLEEITAAMNTTLAYVGDLQDMVTIPRGQLVAPGGFIGAAVAKNVNILVGFSVADITFGFTLPVFKPQTTLFSSTGTIYYTPVVVDRKGIVDKIRWIVGTDTSIFAIDYYEMALCIYNPANGNVEKVWGSGNIRNTTASTTTLAEVQIAMGLNQMCTPGQILFVAHQQVAAGLLQEARTFAAVPQGNIGRPSELLLDAWCYTAPNFSTGIPSTVPFESLTKENRFCPWGAVTANAIVP